MQKATNQVAIRSPEKESNNMNRKHIAATAFFGTAALGLATVPAFAAGGNDAPSDQPTITQTVDTTKPGVERNAWIWSLPNGTILGKCADGYGPQWNTVHDYEHRVYWATVEQPGGKTESVGGFSWSQWHDRMVNDTNFNPIWYGVGDRGNGTETTNPVGYTPKAGELNEGDCVKDGTALPTPNDHFDGGGLTYPIVNTTTSTPTPSATPTDSSSPSASSTESASTEPSTSSSPTDSSTPVPSDSASASSTPSAPETGSSAPSTTSSAPETPSPAPSTSTTPTETPTAPVTSTTPSAPVTSTTPSAPVSTPTKPSSPVSTPSTPVKPKPVATVYQHDTIRVVNKAQAAELQKRIHDGVLPYRGDKLSWGHSKWSFVSLTTTPHNTGRAVVGQTVDLYWALDTAHGAKATQTNGLAWGPKHNLVQTLAGVQVMKASNTYHGGQGSYAVHTDHKA